MSKLQKAVNALTAQGYGEHAVKGLAEAILKEHARWFRNGDKYLFLDPNTCQVSEVTAGAVPPGVALTDIAEAVKLDNVRLLDYSGIEISVKEAIDLLYEERVSVEDMDREQQKAVFANLAKGGGGGGGHRIRTGDHVVHYVAKGSIVHGDVIEKGSIKFGKEDIAGYHIQTATGKTFVPDEDTYLVDYPKTKSKEAAKESAAAVAETKPAENAAPQTETAPVTEAEDTSDVSETVAGDAKTVKCPKCGAMNAADATKCAECGAAMSEPQPEAKGKPEAQESTRTLYLSELTPLAESVVNTDAKTVEVTLIKPGWSANGKYYSADMLKRDAHVFEGVKAYADHPGKNDETNRPERSVRDITGYYTNVRQADDGSLKATRHFVGSVGNETIFPLVVEAITNKPDLMGLSINALGKTKLGEAEGRKGIIVEGLVKGNSVDDVTTPAAGGKYDRLLMAGDEFTTDLLQHLEYEEWRESRPDFVARMKNEMRTARKEELTEAAHAELQTLREQVTQFQTAQAELEEAKTRAVQEVTDRLTESQTRVAELIADRKLVESKLPKAWVETIKPQLAGKTESEMDAVIEAERKKFFATSSPFPVRESGANGLDAGSVVTREQAVVAAALGVNPNEAILEGETPEQWGRRVGKIK